MTFRTLLSAIRRYWLTFVGVTLPLLGLGAAGLYFMPLQYVSTTELLVSIQGSTTAAAYQNDGVVAGRINSYIPLLTSDVVSQRVIDKLKLPLTPPELAAKISAVNVPPSTALIDVAVTDESPDQARLLADTVANEFISYAGALEMPSGEDDQKVSTTVVTAASEPKARIGERIVLGVALALGALALGAVAVWLRARRNVNLSSPSAVVQMTLPATPVSAAATISTPVDLQEEDIHLRTNPARWNEAEPEPVRESLPTSVGDGRPVATAPAHIFGRNHITTAEPDLSPPLQDRAPLQLVDDEGPFPRIRSRLRSAPSAAGGRVLRLSSISADEESDPPHFASLGAERGVARTLSTDDPVPDRPAPDRPEPQRTVEVVTGARHRAPTVVHDDGLDEVSLAATTRAAAADDVKASAGVVNGDGPHAAPAPKEWDGRRWIRPTLSG